MSLPLLPYLDFRHFLDTGAGMRRFVDSENFRVSAGCAYPLLQRSSQASGVSSRTRDELVAKSRAASRKGERKSSPPDENLTAVHRATTARHVGHARMLTACGHARPATPKPSKPWSCVRVPPRFWSFFRTDPPGGLLARSSRVATFHSPRTGY